MEDEADAVPFGLDGVLVGFGFGIGRSNIFLMGASLTFDEDATALEVDGRGGAGRGGPSAEARCDDKAKESTRADSKRIRANGCRAKPDGRLAARLDVGAGPVEASSTRLP